MTVEDPTLFEDVVTGGGHLLNGAHQFINIRRHVAAGPESDTRIGKFIHVVEGVVMVAGAAITAARLAEHAINARQRRLPPGR